MRNKTIFRVAVCIIILLTFILPVSAQQPDKTNEYEVSLKKLMEVTGASASIDEVLSYTLSVAKMNVSEFESPLGERYKESAMGIMRDIIIFLKLTKSINNVFFCNFKMHAIREHCTLKY